MQIARHTTYEATTKPARSCCCSCSNPPAATFLPAEHSCLSWSQQPGIGGAGEALQRCGVRPSFQQHSCLSGTLVVVGMKGEAMHRLPSSIATGQGTWKRDARDEGGEGSMHSPPSSIERSLGERCTRLLHTSTAVPASGWTKPLRGIGRLAASRRAHTSHRLALPAHTLLPSHASRTWVTEPYCMHE